MEEEKKENKNFGYYFFKIIQNKYLLVISIFLIYMTFFSSNSFKASFAYANEINRLKKEISDYETALEECKKNSFQLKSNNENLEKFAREKYFMKKSNEDIYKIE